MPGMLTELKVTAPGRQEAQKGANFLARAASLVAGGLFLKKANGEKVDFELPKELLGIMQTMFGRLAETGEVLLVNKDAELSPEQASKILGISRPMVYHRMDSGRLPFREVGAHRRVLLDDVLKLREFENQRRQMTKALAEDTDDLETNHAQPTPSAARR
jgi:excisionase family DNA binding protein